MAKRVVLASASPRRKELLKEIVSEFDIIPCTSQEGRPDLPPKKFVSYLAEFKATEVFKSLVDKKDKVVIGSDTIVVKGGKIIGKPVDEADAEKILKGLSGKMHRVYTGVCIKSEDKQKVFYVSTRVKFFKLTDKSIRDYIMTGSPMDKAGAYGIQDSGFVKKVVGSMSCVVGLPVEKLKKEIKTFLN